MTQYLLDLAARAGHWAYLVMFLGAMLESAAFLGLLVPGESLVLLAGFLCAQGVLHTDVLMVVVASGAVLGDSIGYQLGRSLGRPGLVRFGSRFGLTAQRIDRADQFFERHGGKSIFLGRFVGFARALVPFLAGSSRMPYRQFLPYNVAGAVAWTIVIVSLGYFLGASWQAASKWIGRASAILGAALLLALVIAWLGRWIIRHETLIKAGWARWLARPWTTRMRLRFAPQIAFVKARLSPGGYLGLELTLAALVMVAAAWVFGGVAEDVATGDPLTLVDAWLAQWLHARMSPGLTQLMLAVSEVHNTIPVIVYGVLIACVLIATRNWPRLIMLVAMLPGGMLLNFAVKQAFQRARPSFVDVASSLATYSFPSGHTMAATVFWGFVAAWVVPNLRQWRWRVMVVMGACLMVALVAFSRIYLGMHYLSDVLASMAEGTAWTALCVIAFRTWDQRHATA